ncbi:MAG: hypothetical protein IIZ61_05375 [Lachnospiraceae bacterium]|nr:hypothetical protein [Lachnospiraceae bacterium]
MFNREYCPTPQWVRENFKLLDGEWEFEGQKIKVPYPPESEMSGFKGKVPENMTYKKTFSLPEKFKTGQVILHFGAVDQIADVFLNDVFIGHHEGGYLSFSFNVTEEIKRDEENVLVVKATDTLSHKYPYGKQRKNRGGMWYTPVSGIWKSVWIESVPEEYIKSVRLTPDLYGVYVEVNLSTKHLDEYALEEDQKITVKINGGEEKSFYETDFYIRIDEPHLWSPDDPYLYDIEFSFMEDKVLSYFGLRTIEIKKIRGKNRVCLNEKPIFLQGILDQGYFPEGIYVPSDKKAYDRDILNMKELGINMLRKHIKIEPPYFYYAADKLGILVMQDMVNNGPYEYFSETIAPTLTFKKRPDIYFRHVDRSRKEFFIRHSKDTLDELYNCTCIVMYTIFNEGWGQFESDRIYDTLKEKDPTRLYDSTSGWFAQERSDFDSEHIYFHNERLRPKERPMLLSECGGYSYGVKGHLFHKKVYGYGAVRSEKELTEKIILMYREMVFPAIAEGLCGVVYTQLSDVEEEINGLYTYDRKVLKVDADKMKKLSKKVFDVLSVHV